MYWLQKHAKKPFVALRFFAQAAYERPGGMSSQRKTQRRAFSCFSVDSLPRTSVRACIREVDSNKIVSMDVGARNESRFRVFEWGVMKVLCFRFSGKPAMYRGSGSRRSSSLNFREI